MLTALWNFVCRIGCLLWQRHEEKAREEKAIDEKAVNLVGGYDQFMNKILQWQTEIEGRLQKCDEEREQQRGELAALRGEVASLKRLNQDLTNQLNRHSVELRQSLGISDTPQIPLRTTRDHCEQPPGDAA